MDEFFSRAWDQLTGRLTGPMAFRFLFQPIMAAVIAVRVGLRDAEAHRPPFLWTVLSDSRARGPMLRSALRDVGFVFGVALVLDTVYQIAVLEFLYPIQAAIVAALLALLPYAALRGLTTRIAAARRRRAAR